MHACIQSIHLSIHLSIRPSFHFTVYMHIYLYVCMCMSVCLPVCLSVCMYVCMHACMHAYTHAYGRVVIRSASELQKDTTSFAKNMLACNVKDDSGSTMNLSSQDQVVESSTEPRPQRIPHVTSGQDLNISVWHSSTASLRGNM